MISCGAMNRRREEAMCSSSHTQRHLSAAIHRLRIVYPEEQSACINLSSFYSTSQDVTKSIRVGDIGPAFYRTHMKTIFESTLPCAEW